MSNYAKSSEKCRSGFSAGAPQRRHFWGAFLWFIHLDELFSGVAALDKQTWGSKLIKNGEENSAPSEEMEFSQISPWMKDLQKQSFQSATASHTYNLYNDHCFHYFYVSQKGLEIDFDQFYLTQLQV